MTKNDQIVQARVGFFLLLGLLLIGGMVVYFGRFGDGMQEYYPIRVEYPNASGLFEGADVLLAGARVGSVREGPHVLDNMRGVYVILKLEEGVQIPEGSAFTIGSSGLLGDSYVDITMPDQLDVENFVPIAPGTVVQGRRETGLGDLAGQGTKLLEDVQSAVKSINTVATRIDKEVLAPETIASIRKTLKNLEDSSAEFAEASKEIDAVIAKAGNAVDEATEMVEGVSEKVEQSQETIDAATRAANSFTKTMEDVQVVIREARRGKGPLGAILSDPTLTENLQSLVYNLRRYGILFYKDRAARDRARANEEEQP